MRFEYDDGGRAAAGFKGDTSDCVTRAIAIAAELPYAEAYAMVNAAGKAERRRDGRQSSARTGVFKKTTRQVMESIGWRWTPTMGIGTGCKVHLHDGELPTGRLIVSVSKHLTAVIDGVIHDTHDPRRESHTMHFNGASSSTDSRVTHQVSRRCVYGYWTKGEANAPV